MGQPRVSLITGGAGGAHAACAERVVHVNRLGTAMMLDALLPLAGEGSSAILVTSGLGYTFNGRGYNHGSNLAGCGGLR